MTDLPRYSVVVPALNEADSLPELVARTLTTFDAMGSGADFEIIIVDDGSTDRTVEVVAVLRQQHPFVHLISFRRNCGKSLALMAGFRAAVGEVVITLDADLQDDPADIPAMIAEIDKGWDLVCGWRRARTETAVRKFGSKLFNSFVTRSTGLRLHDLNCGFKAYRAELLRHLCVFGQYHRFIPVKCALLGFRVTEVEVSNLPRKYGESRYRTLRWEGAFDLLSLLFLHRYGLRPLHFFGPLSAAVMLPSLAILVWLTLSQLLYLVGAGAGFEIFARPILIMAMAGFLSGLLLLSCGFICDFVLHHLIGGRIDSVLATVTRPPPGQ